MANEPKKRVSAFARAREDFSICAEITLTNVIAARPDWTKEQAVAFLREHGDEIGQAMALHGAAMLVTLTGGRNANN